MPQLGVKCSAQKATVTLDASLSFASNGGEITYAWTSDCPDAVFDNPNAIKPNLSFTTNIDAVPVACKAYLTISLDGETLQSACDTVITVDECKKDCFGIIDGTAVYDKCGICDGDGKSCLDCADIDIHGEKTESSATLRSQCRKLSRLVKNYGSMNCAKTKTTRQLKRRHDTLCSQLTLHLESMPDLTSNCEKIECLKIDNRGAIEMFQAGSKELLEMSLRTNKLMAECSSGGVCTRSMKECKQSIRERKHLRKLDIAESRKLYNSLIKESLDLPPYSLSCPVK